MPSEILTAAVELPNILKLQDRNERELEIGDVKVTIKKRIKKRNKWNVSYISGSNFNENKQGLREYDDTTTFMSIKSNYGLIRVGQTSFLDVQIRGFKTQRNIQNDEGNKTSITARLLKWITSNPDNSVFKQRIPFIFRKMYFNKIFKLILKNFLNSLLKHFKIYYLNFLKNALFKIYSKRLDLEKLNYSLFNNFIISRINIQFANEMRKFQISK